MRKNLIIFSIIVLLIVFIGIFYLYKPNNSDLPRVCFNETCFNVEIVDTEAERALGLMNRERMNYDEGMLFIFEESGNYPFWMKNTLIPLDMIWINEKKEVVYIKRNALPCKEDPCEIIDPNSNALYVLEVNSGISAQNNIAIGSIAKFDI